jgi:hypothetical protein
VAAALEGLLDATAGLSRDFRLTEEQSMDALRLVSQDRNVKLRELSAEVAESGALVELD